MKFYSKSTRGFYAVEVHGLNMPPDVVEVSEELYTELLNGQADGKSIQPDANGFPVSVDAPPPGVPHSVTMRQARLALLATGKLAQVNAALAAMPGAEGEAARIEWEFSSEVKRHKELVNSLGPALGLSEAQLDDLFVLASSL